MDRSKELRERADRYRRMLKSVDDPKTRTILLELVQQNEAAAEAAEQAERDDQSPNSSRQKPDR